VWDLIVKRRRKEPNLPSNGRCSSNGGWGGKKEEMKKPGKEIRGGSLVAYNPATYTYSLSRALYI
jgi:hypothetical protein